MAEKAAPAAGSGSGAGVTAAVAALLANLGIVVAKFVGFLVTGASSDLCGATRAGGRSSGRPSNPSSPWCCWRTRPPSWASMAFVGVGLAALTGDPLYDTLGTLAIGVLLAVVAIVLGIERTTRPG
jgi:divalent metal cation (Fe/Co/Zn/Cd) transporter